MSTKPLFKHRLSADPSKAEVRIDPSVRARTPVHPFLRGKFCEHLGSNIYNGMEAQILRNPTFGAWQFGGGDKAVDGGVYAEHDLGRIEEMVRRRAQGGRLPEAEPLLEAYRDSAAFFWVRVGAREKVVFSPDVGPHGGRAQRVETPEASTDAPGGLGQWTQLPLHRTRGYDYRIVARGLSPVELTLTIRRAAPGDDPQKGPVVGKATVPVGAAWTTATGSVTLSAEAERNAGGPFFVSLTAAAPANMVIDRFLLYPDDHINGADPDVVRMLKESKLPILRWPGGNFVSGYRWRDGVGPVDARPTVPNPAWEGLEFNTFGTAEFVAFCREVGCEPMICVNGGDGTPEEAAGWIEYCNGGVDTPMGKLRAEHGHPEPFNIRYWEAGNELYGTWQVNWTTPGGYLDRYLRFRKAMLASDPAIYIVANGDAMKPECPWNTYLIEHARGQPLCISDHLLTGGPVDGDTDPAELFGAFMGMADVLGGWYRGLRDQMEKGGVADAKLAITELQLFARFQDKDGAANKLTPETMPRPDTISEALYFATYYHECARLDGFVNMITHSATVNHGGGLRKAGERVWGNPVHYAHAMTAALDHATPVGVELTSAVYQTTRDFKHIPPLKDMPVLDAVVAEDGERLIVSVVHRGAQAGSVDLSLDLGTNARAAEALQLAGEAMYEKNTRDEPERIRPMKAKVALEDAGARARVKVPPFSLTVIVFQKAHATATPSRT